MVLNLKPQKFVHSSKGLGVFRCHADARAALGVFQFVLNCVAQSLHGLRAGWILRVNQHGGGKIASREHFRDVAEVHADFIAGRSVIRRLGFDFDGAPIGIEPKVMRGSVVREAHDVITALDDALMIVVLRRGLFRRLRKGVQKVNRSVAAARNGFIPTPLSEVEITLLDARNQRRNGTRGTRIIHAVRKICFVIAATRIYFFCF